TSSRPIEIALAPLELDGVGRLIADALHCAPVRAAPLTRLVQEKTAGNPLLAAFCPSKPGRGEVSARPHRSGSPAGRGRCPARSGNTPRFWAPSAHSHPNVARRNAVASVVQDQYYAIPRPSLHPAPVRIRA
ncbi:MAG: hypothetical protein WA412_16115, partial [Candidatus Sulfotelmatobacter sp.]